MKLSQYYAYRPFYTVRLKSIFLTQHSETFSATHIYFGKVLQTNSLRSLHKFLRSNELRYDRYHKIGLEYQLPLRSFYFWTLGKTIKDTIRIIFAHYYLNIFTRWGCKFTLPSLFLYASWIRHTSSGPALAVCFPISKYCTMGLLSRAFCCVPPCLNFENMAVAGIGETRLRTPATQYRVGTMGLAYEQLNVARTLRSCVSSTDDRPIVFTLTCSERDTVPAQSIHFCTCRSSVAYVCGSHRDYKTLLFILKIFYNNSSFTSEFLNEITIVPICCRWPFTQSHAYPDMIICI